MIEESVPSIIFIVPYRDRENQKNLFLRQMSYVLEDMQPSEYQIYFIEQCDTRDFNRGAMKNIGFLAMKQKYPDHYKNITFVFNDVDTMPYRKNYLNYRTTENNIKHFYGYEFALGGIVSILGSDFEKINGYPNFWTWGYEDNTILSRVRREGINVDREQFHSTATKEIIQFVDDIYKKTNRKEFERFMEGTKEGIDGIRDLDLKIDEENNTVRVLGFKTSFELDTNANGVYDIRSDTKPYEYFRRRHRRSVMPMFM